MSGLLQDVCRGFYRKRRGFYRKSTNCYRMTYRECLKRWWSDGMVGGDVHGRSNTGDGSGVEK